MSIFRTALVIWAVLFSCGGVGHAEASCWRSSSVSDGGAIHVVVAGVPLARSPLHLGFNVESVAFANSFWEESVRRPDSGVLDALRSLSGAVFRYPGGATSNRIDLSAAIGGERAVESAVDWLPPSPIRFGPIEYARFATELDSPAWLVLNVMGKGAHREDPGVVALRNLRGVDAVVRERPILGVELGNELYLPRHAMSGAEYGHRLRPTLEALRSAYPSIRPVVGLAGFDMGLVKASRFNGGVVDSLSGQDVDFALHYYYDGPPGGPPLEKALDSLCRTVSWLEERRGSEPAIWITEHGRWPGGKVGEANWKRLWPNSNDLGAALSTTEFVIAASQILEVKGVFLHALGGRGGPWAMFERSPAGALIATPVFRAARLVYDLDGAEILETGVTAPHSRAGPVLRAVGFRHQDGHLMVLATHRGEKTNTMHLSLPSLAGRTVPYEMKVLTGETTTSANTVASPDAVRTISLGGTLTFSASGDADVVVPRLSVIQLKFMGN